MKNVRRFSVKWVFFYEHCGILYQGYYVRKRGARNDCNASGEA